jgi:N-acetylneuraminate synthase
MSTSFEFAYDLVQSAPWPIPRHVYFIAEIGINHNGDLDIAKQLINQAKAAGCDAVKFQKRTIDIVYSPGVLAQKRESPWGSTQREQKEGLEFNQDDYDAIDAHCKQLGIDWFASAWDIPSQHFLRRYNCTYNKVASAMATNLPFLQEVAGERRPTFLSTGICSLDDIDTAVEIFRTADCPVILMHTVSTYPAANKDLNLSVMHSLRERYGLPVGYSGHEPSVSPSIAAAVMGAVAIERHVTLDRAMYGSDQAASLALPGLLNLVGALRKIPECIGDGVKRILPAEDAVGQKLRYWHESN